MKVAVGAAREDGELADIAALDRACSPVLRSEEQCRLLLARGGLILVARAGGGLVGFAAFSQVLDEATLLNIAVDDAVRRRGIASRLLGGALQRLRWRGVRRVLLEARVGNDGAIALYRGLGFCADGVRAGYYAARGELPAEDALLMSLTMEAD